MSSCNLDLDVWPVTGAIGNRLGRLPAGERFIGRAEAQGAVRAVSVVPCRERVKPVLDAAETTTNALNPIRFTQEGETFLRYESGNPAFSRVTPDGGLLPGTFVAPASEGVQPVESLNGLYQPSHT